MAQNNPWLKERTYQDDPEMDGTDFAHPAYLRGECHAHLQFVHMVNNILDGEPASGGLSTMPWEALRQRLYDIRTMLGIAERVVMSTPGLDREQWYKVRRDYEQRIQGLRAQRAQILAAQRIRGENAPW